MLKHLSISNFKPFGETQSMRMAPITLIYGPNSGGKSSLIQSLLLLRQSFEKAETNQKAIELVPSGNFTDLGTVKNCFHKQDMSRTVKVELTLPIEEAQNEVPFFKEVSTELSFSIDKQTPVEQVNNAFLDNLKLTYCPHETDLSRTEYSFNINLINPSFQGNLGGKKSQVIGYHFANQKDFINFMKIIFQDLKSHLTKEEVRELINNLNDDQDYPSGTTGKDAGRNPFFWGWKGQLPLLYVDDEDKQGLFSPAEDLWRKVYQEEKRKVLFHLLNPLASTDCALYTNAINAVNSFIEDLEYLGPLRNYPCRFQDFTESDDENSVGIRGENSAFVFFANTRLIGSELNKWLEKLEMPYLIHPKIIGDENTGKLLLLQIQDRDSLIKLSPKDVGCGISQILPILIQGLSSKERTIIVEQPELHLHPRMQANLADFFIDNIKSRCVYVGEGSEEFDDDDSHYKLLGENQWLIETHSETLILRIQRRIRQKTISPEDVCVLYVNPTKNGSEVIELRLDEQGDFIDSWPHGFFDEDLVEIFGDDV